MARLPQPGKDTGSWGDILNDYLSQTHKPDGTLKNDSVGSAQIADNAITSSALAPNSITNAAIASGAVNATSIADGSLTNALFADGTIAETKLTNAIQTKLNQAAPTWGTLSGKPTVVAAGANPAAARIAVDAGMAQRARYGSRVVLDGNSITIGAASESGGNQSRGGWGMEMARLSNGRIDIIYNAAVASTSMTTRLANFDAKVAPYNPETVILSEGTNELADTVSDYIAKVGQYYDKVCAIGAQLIVGGIYPKDVDTAKIATFNTALLAWAAPRGVIVIPFWELADPATGAWPAGWTSDGTHPLRESAAYSALGTLAWQTVKWAFTEPVAPTARYAGEGILTNFFTDLTATITGLATITAITSTTGTLAAGTYDYRVVAANRYGKSPTYDDDTITLGATGGVQITVGGSGTYNRRIVYRKGPGESVFKYVGQITTTGSQVFTDNGLTAQYNWFDGDSSRYPNGLANGATQESRTLAYGPIILTDSSVRGNVLRLARQESSLNAHADYFLVSGLTVGQEITVTVKCRGADTTMATERVILRFRDSGDTTTVFQGTLAYHRLGSTWGLVYGKFTVPAGSDRIRVSFEGDATSPYIDIAELRVA